MHVVIKIFNSATFQVFKADKLQKERYRNTALLVRVILINK